MRVMRMVVMLGFLLAGSVSAQREWHSGTWDAASTGPEYVLEGTNEFITAELMSGTAPIDAAKGTVVQYSIEESALFVRVANGNDRSLRLLKAAPKYSNEYGAIGGGHYIKEVAADGSRVTLEDGSRWDMDPRAHFSVAEWQPDDLIAIRRSSDDPLFPFNVSNTTRDDGAVGKRLAR